MTIPHPFEMAADALRSLADDPSEGALLPHLVTGLRRMLGARSVELVGRRGPDGAGMTPRDGDSITREVSVAGTVVADLVVHPGAIRPDPTVIDFATALVAAALRSVLDPATSSGGPATEPRPDDGRLSAVLHTLPQPVLIVDDSGHLTHLNSAAAELFGLSVEFDVGRPVAGRLGHPRLETMLGDAEEATVELTMTAAETTTWLAAVRRIIEPGGRTSGRLLVLDDITSRHRCEQQQDDFVAVIGHELRTPITVIRSALAALDRELAGQPVDSIAHRTLDTLERGVERIQRLVDDVLLLADLDRGRTPSADDGIDVVALVRAVTGPRVTAQHPDDVPTVPGDPTRAAEALRQLVDNAIKYTEGPVEVRVTDLDSSVEVAVVDHGPGIPSDELPTLFDRFRQVDGTSTRRHGGTGLGLHLCRRLMETMDGRVRCDTRLGAGTTFTLRFPRTSDRTGPSPERRRPRRGVGTDGAPTPI